MSETPSWIDPRARLIEDGQTLGWVDLDRLAERLAPLLAGRGGVLPAQSCGEVVAALIAAERAARPLTLLRHAAPSLLPPEGEGGFSVRLQTSGTSGEPKLVRHSFERLRGRLRGADPEARWLVAFEPAAFAGLQVILTALAGGATLIAPGGGAGAGVAALARAALDHRATHISGTPTFWRSFLLALGAEDLPLRAVTLGGEPADQPLLDRLAERFPAARLRHIYASTEAGALFAVADGRAGFPASWLASGVDGVELRVRDGVLEVRSPRAAPAFGDGWLATGDLVEVDGGRVQFVGRADGRVSVGGVKVSPEAAERCLLAVPGVAEAMVGAVPSPLTGHLLTATVVPLPGVEEADLRVRLQAALAGLPPAARPRLLTFAARLEVGASGKKRRVPTA